MRATFLITATLGLGLLAPGSGEAQLWRAVLDGPGFAQAIRLDGAGDVLAAGETTDAQGEHFTVAKVAGTTGARRWRADVRGSGDGAGTALAVAVDPAGDAVAAGQVRNEGRGGDFAVVKLAGTDGALHWRLDLDGGAHDDDLALAVAVDAAGDVVAAGGTTSADRARALTVVKLAGADGALRWRYDLVAPPFGQAQAVAVDAAGDVIVVGGSGGSFTVVKLAGGTGAELWRYGTQGLAVGVALDPAGDVLAVGTTGTLATHDDLTVVKLAGASGAERWRAALDGLQHSDDAGADVAVDAGGDVVACGLLRDTEPFNYDFAVVKLAGAEGTERWRHVIDGTTASNDIALRIAVDGSGDVVAAGTIEQATSRNDFAVVKLAGADGTERWRRVLRGTGAASDEARGLALDAAGDVLAGGRITTASGSFAVVKFDGATGGGFPASGIDLRLKDNAAKPRKRKLTVLSADPDLPQAPLGSAGDPTAGGGLLELVDPGSGERAVVALPAANWRPLGDPAGTGGYRYEELPRSGGPCRAVVLAPGRLFARCIGEGLAFSLNEPAQGRLAVRLATGAAGLRRCLLFGGAVVRDVPTAGPRPGVFHAKGAPAPDACP